MSFIRVNEVGGDSLERVNKLPHNIPGGVYKAAFSALRRAGDSSQDPRRTVRRRRVHHQQG